MKMLLTELREVLKEDERFFTDDTLLKNKTIERALDNDEQLLELLLSNERLKEHFFTEAGEHLVFNDEKFVQFVSNKQFLPNSYTAFKNKVGLKQGNKFLQEKKEIELVWPYKDCVLEGGQTKEDEDRDEKFWNKTLAPDQVDKLLDSKALNNFKRYTEDGEQDIDEISEDDNLFIRGNNLLALESIKKRYRGEIDLIYIDPPYNTDRDSFRYNDSFNESSWLTFMKNRLESTKQLLSEDGLIFVQCDDNEQAYLKVMMDEIYGRDNFVSCITVKMSELSGPKMAHADKKYPKLKEYILCYKKQNIQLKEVETERETWDSEYNVFLENFTERDYQTIKSFDPECEDINKIDDLLEDVEMVSLEKKMKEKDIDEANQFEWKKENSYRIIRTVAADNVFKLAENKALYEKDQSICATISSTKKLYLLKTDYSRSAKSPRIQIVFSRDGLKKPLGDLWTDISTTGLHTEGSVTLENGKKPEKLIKRIIESTTDEGDKILDFFLGSGTTAAVAHKMNRQYIGIEQLDYGDSDPTVRLKNVIEGDDTGISDVVGWESGGDFVYAELMQWNAEFVERIDGAESSKEIKELWSDMKDQAFLSYRIDVEVFEENTGEFEDLELEKQKEFLREILDNNQLYVNYSEIEDSSYEIVEETIELNKQFYTGE